MKKILLFILSTVVFAGVHASQYTYLTFVSGNDTTLMSVSGLEMRIQDDELLIYNDLVDDVRLPITQLSKMYFSDEKGEGGDVDMQTNSTVYITYNEGSAVVSVAENISEYVTVSVSGSKVVVSQSDEVSDETCGEISYFLSGATTDGSFSLFADFRTTIVLDNIDLNNESGPALNFQNEKCTVLSVKSETENYLSDGTDGDWNGCIVSVGSLELKGKGVLNLCGNTAHGILSNESCEQKNCTVNVLSAVQDGINCSQYFLMESGELNIKGFSDDGIQVSVKDGGATDDTGNFIQTGGDITIYMSGATGDGVSLAGVMSRVGGTLTIIEDTRLKPVGVDFEKPLKCYTLLGVLVGEYDSLKEVPSGLLSGVYVVTQGSNAVKIIR